MKTISSDADKAENSNPDAQSRQDEAYFQALVENSNDAIMVFNSDGSRRYISPSAENVLGINWDKLNNQVASSYFHRDDANILSDAVATVVANPLQTVIVSYRVKQENGEWRRIEAKIKNLCDDTRVAGILVNARNISEIRDFEQALQEKQKHLSNLLAAIPVGVYETDSEGHYTFVNEKWRELTGLDVSHALGDGWINGIYPEDRKRVLQDWASAKAHHQPLHHEYRLVNTKGEVTWVLGRALAVYNDSNEICGYRGTFTDISERIAAEQALRESEIRFRKLFDTSPTPIGLTRMSDGCFLDANQALSELFGWSREEFIGKSSFELGMWVNEVERQAITSKLKNREPVRNMQLQVRLRSGEIRDTLTSVDTMELDGIPCLLVSSTDVTEQIKAVSLIKQHSRLLDTLSAVNELLLQESDPNSLFEKTCQVIVNQAGFRMAWVGIADLVEGSVTPVADAGMEEGYLSSIKIRCDNSEWAQGATGTAIRENRTVVVVDINRNPNYELWRQQVEKHNFRSSIALPLRHNDQVFGALNIYSKYANDFGAEELPLLERMSADLGLVHERLEMQKALQNSENRLASFFSDAPAGLALYDKEIKFLQINSTLAELGIGSTENVIGKRPREVLSSDLAEFIESNVKAVFDRGQPLINKEYAGIFPKSEEKLRHWMHSHFPVRDTEGGVYAVGGFAIEVTMQKKAEAALKRLNQELESRVAERTGALASANAELESFAYSVSHDLRTPLRSINGFSQILLEDYGNSLDREACQYLNRIIKAVNHMGALIDALLALSRLSTKELIVSEISSENVTTMVNEVIREIELENKPLHIEWHINSLAPCKADSILLRQVWFNLIHNAVKYSSHRNHPIIQIGMHEHDGDSIYYVRDNGIGFENEYIGKLFGVFQRLHKPEEFEGTGIGLATVKRIVDMLGGQVWAEGELNKGATFYFKLSNMN